MQRVLIACTAASLLGVLSALLDYSLAQRMLWPSAKAGLRPELERLVSVLWTRGEELAATLNRSRDAVAETARGGRHGAPDDAEPPHFLAASMMPLPDILPEPSQAEAVQDVNRDIKADRLLTENAVPKLILPKPDPIGQGANAALFLLSTAIPVAAAIPALPTPPAVASAESGNIVAGPVASAARMSRSIVAPVKSPFITSATTVATTPAPAKDGWNDLVRMASVKGGDGEEPNKPFGALSEKEFRARELRCMATAIYFEARGETVRGQIAVGQVIMTRMRSDFYPNTICGVVFQGQWNKNACQFSFACDGVTDAPKEKEQWAAALDVAKQVVSGKVFLTDIAEATHYHAVYVRPDWARQIKRIKQIGVHIFYKAPFVQPLASNPNYRAM